MYLSTIRKHALVLEPTLYNCHVSTCHMSTCHMSTRHMSTATETNNHVMGSYTVPVRQSLSILDILLKIL